MSANAAYEFFLCHISPIYQFNTFLPARDAGLDHAVVHQRSQCVHEEDRKHHTFGIGRIDHTDQHGERTGEESDDILARTGLGRRDGIGGHEHGAESETADDQMLPSGVGRHAECLEKYPIARPPIKTNDIVRHEATPVKSRIAAPIRIASVEVSPTQPGMNPRKASAVE